MTHLASLCNFLPLSLIPSVLLPFLQVLRVYPGGRLLVRMVPRLNLQILSLPKEQRPKGFAAAGGGRGGARPPQRFFDKAEILELSGCVTLLPRACRCCCRASAFAAWPHTNSRVYRPVCICQHEQPLALST